MTYLTGHWAFDPFLIVVAVLVIWHETGLARLDRSRRALTELIGAAGKALSEAKTTGRNKVCVLPGFAESG